VASILGSESHSALKTLRRCHWVDIIYGFQPKETASPWDTMMRMHQKRHEVAAYHQPNGNALGLKTKKTTRRSERAT
jgi:hypothetical protein